MGNNPMMSLGTVDGRSQIEKLDLEGVIMEMLEEITPQEAYIIKAIDFFGLTSQEVAFSLAGKTPSAVRNIRFRALRRLNDRFQNIRVELFGTSERIGKHLRQ